jgi:hypothetical protein
MCNCIEIVDEKLSKEHGCKLDVPLLLQPANLATEVPKVSIATYRVDGNKRKKPITLTAPFCPFCGERYDEASAP